MYEEQPIHPAPTSFISKYVFSMDHKVIAKQFLFLGLFFLLVGGFLAMLIRWQLGYPGEPFPIVGKLLYPSSNGIVNAPSYASLFTVHGTIMIFFAITPILIGAFGNFCIPLMIGARDMAFPVLNMMSFWFAAIASVVLTVSAFVPLGAAAGGWTMYPPLSTTLGQPGVGATLWVVSVFFIGASSIVGAVNYVTTVIRFRAPGMTYFKMPLTVWGLWLTAILNALFVPVLGAGMIATGVVRITLGIHLGAPLRRPVLLAGVLTALVGVLIVAGWPANSFAILGVLLGLDLLFWGTAWIRFGLRLRRY